LKDKVNPINVVLIVCEVLKIVLLGMNICFWRNFDWKKI